MRAGAWAAGWLTWTMVSAWAAGDYLDVPVQPAAPVPAAVSNAPTPGGAPPPPPPPGPEVAPVPPMAPGSGSGGEGFRERKRPRPPGFVEGQPGQPGQPGMLPEGQRPFRPPGEMRPGRPFPGGGHGDGFYPDNRKVMELLFLVPPDRLAQELDKLPKFKERPPEEKQRLIQRIQRMYEERKQEALRRAREAGITVPAGREDEFTRAYFKGRREVEETLRREMEPRRQVLEKEAIEALRKAFGGA